VVSVDLVTGQVLQTLGLGDGTITGLAREGTTLYSMSTGKVLRAIDISGPSMVAKGSLTLSSGGGQLFVGNGIAYVPVGSTLSAGGYSTVNVGDPTHLILIAGPSQPTTGKPGTAIVANGSGLGLLAGALGFVFGGFTAVDLVSLSDPTNTYNFLTRFNLPDAPNGLAIASGIAYIADNTAGLQVVNYVPFDTNGVSPTVSISTPATDLDPSTPGLQVLEGATLPVQVNVSDDVQVRNVELLVNGQVVQNAVSFPFDLSAISPTIATSGGSFTIQVRATDTGGNVAFSNTLVVGLVKDTFPPTIVSFVPPTNSSQVEAIQTVQVLFSEPMAVPTVNTATVRLLDSAGNYITPTSFVLRANDQLAELTFAPILMGNYQIVVSGAVTDRVGNVLSTSDVVSPFTLTPRASISTNVPDADPSTPGLQVYEGTTLPLTVSITPGVLVQKVELLVNSQVAASSTTAPFQFSVIAPNITPSSSSLILQARVTDTGGLATLTNLISVGLLEDITPPTIASVNPAPGAAAFAGLTKVTVTFSEPIATASVSTANFHLFKAGSSGVFDGTETEVPINGFQLVSDDTRVQLTTAPLAVGIYELRITQDGITDRALNPLGTGIFTSDFNLQAQLFQNGSFETGDYTGWTLLENSSIRSFGTWGIASDGQVINPGQFTFDYFDQVLVQQFSPGLPRTYRATDGQFLAYQLQNGPELHRMFQDVTLPPNTTSLTWDMFYTNFFGFFDPNFQFLAVDVRDLSDQILQTLFITTQGVNPQSIPMSSFSVDLSAFAGTTVRIDIEMNVQDYYFDAGFDNFVIHTGGGQPQFLAGAPKASAAGTASLTQSQLQPVVSQAIAQLATAGYNVSGLSNVQFHVAALPGSLLGLTYQNNIWIDPNAQGYGWYIDIFPSSNAAFTQVTSTDEVQAIPGSPAYGHVDLLTVVTHELGHVLGFASIDPGVLDHDWMTATLGTGVRRAPNVVGGSEPTSVLGLQAPRVVKQSPPSCASPLVGGSITSSTPISATLNRGPSLSMPRLSATTPNGAVAFAERPTLWNPLRGARPSTGQVSPVARSVSAGDAVVGVRGGQFLDPIETRYLDLVLGSPELLKELRDPTTWLSDELWTQILPFDQRRRVQSAIGAARVIQGSTS
jgi:hypothetical protein